MGACETTPPATNREHPRPFHHSANGTLPRSQMISSPLAGVQLVRPRRYAAAGAPAGPLQRGNENPAAARKIPKNSQASPTTATHVTGSNRYALLTTVALMGAAERGVWPVLVLMCYEETCSACCSPTSPRIHTARVKHVRHRVPGDRRHGGPWTGEGTGSQPAGAAAGSTALIIHGWPRDDRLQTPISVGGPLWPRRRHAPPHQPPRRGSSPCRRTTAGDVASPPRPG